MNNTKLTKEAILANIDHYESLIQQDYHVWMKHVQDLQYWLEQLEFLETVSA